MDGRRLSYLVLYVYNCLVLYIIYIVVVVVHSVLLSCMSPVSHVTSLTTVICSILSSRHWTVYIVLYSLTLGFAWFCCSFIYLLFSVVINQLSVDWLLNFQLISCCQCLIMTGSNTSRQSVTISIFQSVDHRLRSMFNCSVMWAPLLIRACWPIF